MTTPRAPQCGDSGGENARGEPCRRTLGLDEDGRCSLHPTDPEAAAAAQARWAASQANGGRISGIVRRTAAEARATVEPENLPRFEPDTFERVSAWHRWAARAVATGEISTRVGDAVCRHLKEQRVVLEKIGLEQRVKQLETDLRRAKATLAREDGRR